ncbi:helix-turn-helix transcriptional regulator [Colwelliaceae bacterium 6471]
MNSEYIRLPQVLYLTGLGKTSIYKLMNAKEFPQAISFGARRIAWKRSDIQSWIESKIQARQSQ